MKVYLEQHTIEALQKSNIFLDNFEADLVMDPISTLAYARNALGDEAFNKAVLHHVRELSNNNEVENFGVLVEVVARVALGMLDIGALSAQSQSGGIHMLWGLGGCRMGTVLQLLGTVDVMHAELRDRASCEMDEVQRG